MKNKEKNWSAFYRQGLAPKEPTDFCRFIMGLNIPADSVIDVGCGNGRDAKLLSERYITIGIDKNFEASQSSIRDYIKVPASNLMTAIIADDFVNFLPLIRNAGIIYSRFFLHSISNHDIITLLRNTKRYFCAEFRIKGDKPKLYQDHERNFIDPADLMRLAIDCGFEIIYYYQGNGLAKYKDEDPLVGRIVLRRKLWRE